MVVHQELVDYGMGGFGKIPPNIIMKLILLQFHQQEMQQDFGDLTQLKDNRWCIK